MKSLTLQEPWASLIAVGAKSIETRNWHPQINPGIIGIAYSKSALSHAQRYFSSSEPFASALADVELSRGAIIAVARIDKFARTEAITTLHDCDCPATNDPPDQCICAELEHSTADMAEGGTISYPESAFGNYQPRRWAWFLDPVVALKEPIQIPSTPRGKRAIAGLGLWDIPIGLMTDELRNAVEQIESSKGK